MRPTQSHFVRVYGRQAFQNRGAELAHPGERLSGIKPGS
jgi:hypothetical protein